MARATIRDVAALAGVSVGTVSMVLNDSPKVTPKTRETVKYAIDKLDYRRNSYARSLSLNRSHTIGLIVTDLTNPYFGMMVKHVQVETDKHHCALMLGTSGDSVGKEKELVESLVLSGVDGLLLVPCYAREPEVSHIHALIGRRFPLVSLSAHYPGIELNCCMTDLLRGSFEMTRYLIERGHRRILMISGYRGLVLTERRVAGFKEAHLASGLQVSDEQIIEADEPSFEGGYRVIKRALQNYRPDAIMTINDVLAMGVMSYLHEAGVRVPEDISVTGYDDLIYSAMLETPLTTVRQPIKEMCAAGVEMLFSLIEGGSDALEPTLLPPRLTIRGSTAER